MDEITSPPQMRLPSSIVTGRIRCIAYIPSWFKATALEIVRGKGGRPLVDNKTQEPMTKEVEVTFIQIDAGGLEIQLPCNQDFIVGAWLPFLNEILDDAHRGLAAQVFLNPKITIAKAGDLPI